MYQAMNTDQLCFQIPKHPIESLNLEQLNFILTGIRDTGNLKLTTLTFLPKPFFNKR